MRTRGQRLIDLRGLEGVLVFVPSRAYTMLSNVHINRYTHAGTCVRGYANRMIDTLAPSLPSALYFIPSAELISLEGTWQCINWIQKCSLFLPFYPFQSSSFELVKNYFVDFDWMCFNKFDKTEFHSYPIHLSFKLKAKLKISFGISLFFKLICTSS